MNSLTMMITILSKPLLMMRLIILQRTCLMMRRTQEQTQPPVALLNTQFLKQGLDRWQQVFTWSSCNAFKGEITTTIFFWIYKQGHNKWHWFFPKPVPAITKESSPKYSAFPTSTCQGYGNFPGLQWQNSASNVTWDDSLSFWRHCPKHFASAQWVAWLLSGGYLDVIV